MEHRNAMHAKNGTPLLLATVLCALAVLAGCSQQSTASVTEQAEAQSQAESTQASS